MSRRYPGEDLDDAADRLHDEHVQDVIDDEAELREAKRRAAGTSPEELSLQDARIAGAEAGMRGTAASLNPYQDYTPEHDEWERARLQALSQSLARLVA